MPAPSKTGQPKISDLRDVKQGKNWHVGNLTEQHPTFRHLRQGALVGWWANVRTFFDSIEELGWQPARGKSSDRGRKDAETPSDFHTFKSLAEATDVFRNNPKSIRAFKSEDVELKSEENVGRDVWFDVTGDYLDIGKYLEDQPECFGVAYNGNPAGLHVTIYADAGAVYYVKKQAMAHKQARMLRLVDWLEQQGVRCRITVVESTECGHAEIVVKDYGDAVNLNDIAITMHPDFLRRHMFLFDEQSPTWESGYGSAVVWSQAMKRNYTADPADGLTVFITSQSSNELEKIDFAFDRLRDKIAALLSGLAQETVAGEETVQRDFTQVYAVEI